MGKFNDRYIQDMMQRKLVDAMFNVAPEALTFTALGTSTVNTEGLTVEKLQAAHALIEKDFKAHKEDTIKWLRIMGFTVIINQFGTEMDKPIIMLNPEYQEAWDNVILRER